MADSKKNVFLDFLVRGDKKAASAVKGVGQEAEKSQSRFSKLTTGGKALASGFAAIAATKVVGFLGDAAKAALEDEKAQVQLAVALRNTVGATDEQISSTETWIDSTARATGITDDELRPALANLVRATGDVEEAQKLMGTAMDIATARALPLETVSLALTKAAQGNVGAMGRLGLNVRDTAGGFLEFDDAIAKVNETMGGATTEAAESAEGQIRRMNVTIDEAKETLGGLLLPVLAEAARGINLLGTEIQQWTGQISDMDAAIVTWQTHMGESADTAAAALQIWQTGSIEWGELLDKLELAPAELMKLRDASDEYLLTQGVTNGTIDEFRQNTENAIAASLDSRAEQTKQVASLGGVAGAYEDAADAAKTLGDRQLEAIDPAFRAMQTQDRYTEALQKYNDAVAEHGPKSDEATDALDDLTRAHLEAEAAAETLASEGLEKTIEAYEDAALAAGGVRDTVDAAADSMRNANKVKPPPWFGRVVREDAVYGKRASGGPVSAGRSYLVGERGPELLTMGATQNGYVTANGKMGGPSYMIGPIYASGTREGAVAGKAIVEAIKEFEKRNGSAWRR